jgi:hypothetical protein
MYRFETQKINYRSTAPRFVTATLHHDLRDAVKMVRAQNVNKDVSVRVYDRKTGRVLYVNSHISREYVPQNSTAFGAFLIALKLNGVRPGTAAEFKTYTDVLKGGRSTPLPG